MVGQRRINPGWIAFAFIALIGTSVCVALVIASSSLTPADERLRSPRQYLSAALTTEPARSVGGLLLSTGAVVFVLAALARKLELDLRRVQLPRKEAPIGIAPTVCDDWSKTENIALSLHVAAAIGALGVSAVSFASHPRAHRAFASLFFVGGSVSAVANTVVDHGLGNTCSLRVRRARAAAAALAAATSCSFFAIDPSAGTNAAVVCEAAQLVCVAMLCVHYATWIRSFSSFTVLASAADVRTGLSRDTSWARGLGGMGGLSDDEDDYSVAELGESGDGSSVRGSANSLVSKISEMLGGGSPGKSGGQGGANRHEPRVPYSPARVSGLRASPMAPGVPRVDSSDRIYRQLHEPFMRAHMEHQEQRSSNLGVNRKLPFEG